MKKIYGFALASAALMLASCSNDTEPTPNPSPETPADAGYMAINIVNPTGTRAMNDVTNGGFVDGDKDKGENTAPTGTFLFFKGEAQTQVPQTVMLEFQDNTEESGPAVEMISKAVVVVGGAGKDNAPEELLVILNDPGIDFRGMTKKDVLDKVTAADVATKDKFIMTNASYYETPETDPKTPAIIQGTKLEGKVFSTRQEASKPENTVDVYVERLAARVDIDTNGEDFKIEPTGEFQVNGAEGGKMNLYPVITGIMLADQAADEYLFKKIDTDWIGNWNLVDDNTNKRANWATVPDQTGKYINHSYNDYIAQINGNGLAKEGYYFYTRENTNEVGQETTLTANRNTSLLLTAQLCTTKDDATTAIKALVRWAGLYYTPDTFKTQALNFISKYCKKETGTSGDTYSPLITDPKDLAYLTAEEHKAKFEANEIAQYEMALKLAADPTETVYVKEGDNWTEVKDAAAAINATLLEKVNRCWYWEQGRSYYYLEIAHDGITDGTSEKEATYDFTKGVIRNNVYKIKLTGLKGLGVPVFNPEEEIIPVNPHEDLFYIGAKINILKWRIVSQNANFENVPV